MLTPKMYVLARKDLNTVYALVQGTHAVAQYSLEHAEGFHQWNNETIAVLAVRNLKALREWNLKLAKADKAHSFFREPDLDNQETAIACYDDGKIFKGLKSFC